MDLAKPIAPTLRSRAEIVRGEIHHEQFRWSANVELPAAATKQFNEMSRRLQGFRVAVIGGIVSRDDTSRIRARLSWSMPHDELVKFAIDKKLMDVEYLALSDQISTDPEHPTVFDVIHNIEVREGEAIFDIMQWETQTAGVPMKMRYTGTATGYIADLVFQGSFKAQYYCDIPAMPSLKIQMETEGTFKIEIDGR